MKLKVLLAVGCCALLAAGFFAAAGSADDPPPTDTSTTATAPVDTPTTTAPPTTATTATPAVPDIAWGAADDASKFADDGGDWFYGELKGASLTQNRWTLAFDPSNPTSIKELPFLERAAPKAQAAGIRIILVL